MSNPVNSISPLDGRYHNKTKLLRPYFSESALIKYRVQVEIEYLISLSKEKKIPELKPFNEKEKKRLRNIYLNFSVDDALDVKAIEKTTNHDVKAIEYFLQKKIKKSIHPWIHFCLTSEDVNNLSYSLMWMNALKGPYLTQLINLNRSIRKLAKRYKKVPILSLTHGQPATPSTFGKEYAVFFKRLDRQILQLKSHKFLGKFGGATGTWSAHETIYPKVNWLNFAKKFIRSMGLEPNLITTQIEPHDSIIESYHNILRINSILADLCQDMWLYISRSIVKQKKLAGEIGSSTMPHKINPIQFENAEGNFGISNAILEFLARKLAISRMQRDLTDSTTIRNQGVALAHSYISLISIASGLGRIDVDLEKTKKELNDHWEVLTEPIQTAIRKSGKKSGYEQMMDLSKGKKIDESMIKNIINKLKISDEDKKSLLKLSPSSYTGLAEKLTDLL